MSFRRPRGARAVRVRSATLQLIERLEARALLAAVSWDGGGDGVNWTSPNNWSPNGLPQTADDVTIDIAADPTITLNGANAVVRSLTSAEALNLNNGTLSLAMNSTVTSAVTLSGATLTGVGNLTLAGPLSWTDGTMRGSGKTILIAGSTSTISGDVSKALARTLEVPGTLTHTGGFIGIGISASEPGTIKIKSGGRFNADAANLVSASDAAKPFSGIDVDVGGMFAKTTAITTNVTVPFNNAGTVKLDAGN